MHLNDDLLGSLFSDARDTAKIVRLFTEDGRTDVIDGKTRENCQGKFWSNATDRQELEEQLLFFQTRKAVKRDVVLPDEQIGVEVEQIANLCIA